MVLSQGGKGKESVLSQDTQHLFSRQLIYHLTHLRRWRGKKKRHHLSFFRFSFFSIPFFFNSVFVAEISLYLASPTVLFASSLPCLAPSIFGHCSASILCYHSLSAFLLRPPIRLIHLPTNFVSSISIILPPSHLPSYLSILPGLRTPNISSTSRRRGGDSSVGLQTKQHTSRVSCLLSSVSQLVYINAVLCLSSTFPSFDAPLITSDRCSICATSTFRSIPAAISFDPSAHPPPPCCGGPFQAPPNACLSD